MFLLLVIPIQLLIAQNEVENLRLKDFRPKSLYKGQNTSLTSAKYPAIDMHSHPYAKTNEQLQEWVKNMEEVGVEKSVVMTYATGARFDSLYEVYSQYPVFEIWCGFDYSGYDQPGFGPAAVAELERCYQVGARGVGELGDKGKGLFYCKPPALGMHSNDDRMASLFRKCGELNMPVNIHVAEPIWMYVPMDSTNDGLMNAFNWRLDNRPGIVDHNGMMVILEETVKKYPGTTIIACHLANCSYDLSIVGSMLDKFANFYIDIGARFGEFSPTPRTTGAFFEKYQDRILYGTDMGFSPEMYRTTFRILESSDEHFYAHDQFSYHWPLYGLDLDEVILEKIYRLNALRITNDD